MRRTITTLMFLALCGPTVAVQADEQTHALSSWQYYSTGSGSVRVSDDDDQPGPASVATAVGQPRTGSEKNALYVAEGPGKTGIKLTNYFNEGCGCGPTGCGPAGCDTGGDSCCDCCTVNGFRFEYLGWFSRGRNTPPLVSTGALAAGAGGAAPGVVLFGNDPIGRGLRSGGRLTLSHLFADGITSGDFRFWGISDGSAGFFTNSAQNAVFGYPFIQANNPGAGPAFLPISNPLIGEVGQTNVLAKNDLIGADVYLRRSWFDDSYGALEFLAGYQFARLDDSLELNSTFSNPPFLVSTTLFDSFRTQNEFHGGTFGVLAKSYRGQFTLETLAKLGFGNMRQAVAINGTNTTGGLVNPGGFFALSSNIGNFQRNRMAYVPELNVNLIYEYSQSLRFMTGYNFIYWSSVVLAGNQIDPNINLNLIGGPPGQQPNVPAFAFQRTDFWVQGVSLGAEYRW